MVDVFCFPTEEIQRIYDYYQIGKCLLYQNLTDTDSTSLLFTFICKFESSIPESEARNIIFECVKKSKILNRLDLPNDFWKKHDVYDYSTKKQMGDYSKLKILIIKIFVQLQLTQKSILKNLKIEK